MDFVACSIDGLFPKIVTHWTADCAGLEFQQIGLRTK
jgi:hypothetical protein